MALHGLTVTVHQCQVLVMDTDPLIIILWEGILIRSSYKGSLKETGV